MVKLVNPSVEIITDLNGTQILKHLELCARNCYKSEGNITEDLTSAKNMINKLLDLNHTAMIEHFSATFKLRCDIGVYKDLTRHRHCSFAIESTRYCNYSKGKFGNEISVIVPINIEPDTGPFSAWYCGMCEMEHRYMQMAEAGCTPDQMRMLLPHSTAASVICTCNMRELRHIFGLRCAKAAHPSVRQAMLMTLEEFHNRIPVLFDDLYETYKEDIEEFKNRTEDYAKRLKVNEI